MSSFKRNLTEKWPKYINRQFQKRKYRWSVNKKVSNFPGNQKMQIKTTVRYNFVPPN